MERSLESMNIHPQKLKYIREVLNPFLAPIIKAIIRDLPDNIGEYMLNHLESNHRNSSVSISCHEFNVCR